MGGRHRETTDSRPEFPAGGRSEIDMSGNADQAKGRVKEAAGAITGDKDLKNEGKADQVGGKVKDAVDTVKDKLTGKD